MKKPLYLFIVCAAALCLTGCHEFHAHDHGDVAEIPRVALKEVKGDAATPVDARIRQAQGWIKAVPDKPKGYNALGQALMQRGRETGDLANYGASLTAFEKAVELAPKDPESAHNLAWAYTMFHRFDKAIELAKQALTEDTTDPFAWGVLFDSYIELGRYDEAAEAAQKMMDQRPDLASYSRAAQMRWIDGDVKSAILFMQRAVAAGGSYVENTAWCQTQLGDLYFKTGAYLAAKQAYEVVWSKNKTDRHAAFGLANAKLALGETEGVATLFETSVAGNAPLSYLLDYAGYLRNQGNAEQADQVLARVPKAIAEHRRHGILGDELMEAEYLLDHKGELSQGLKLAAEEAKAHNSWQALGTYAWALYQNKQYKEAKATMLKARRTGIADARLIHRQGLIMKALGDEAEATKLAALARSLHPKFDQLSPK